VVNGSRLHLAQAQGRFGSKLLPVCLQVSPDVLAARLRQRGREDEAEIARRLARAAQPQPDGCLILNNDGALADRRGHCGTAAGLQLSRLSAGAAQQRPCAGALQRAD